MKNHMPSHPLDEEVFEDVFLAEIDSWFSADLACCDHCYDEFVKHWPVAYYADGQVFQTNQIQLDPFYDGSRIRDFYTLDQFIRLATELPCPRCGGKLGYTIYPYNFPFDVPDNFEDNMREISAIAESTPFLLLKHKFSAEVLEAINNVASHTVDSEMPSPLFRARPLAGLKDFDVAQFDFAPRDIVSEGRYNHAGGSALYLSDSHETCFHEVNDEVCAIAEIGFNGRIKVLDLVQPYESHKEFSDLLNTLVYSALLSEPRNGKGFRKTEYVFSRFIADCARSAGFDAIKFPSIKALNDCFNLVVLNRDFSIGKKTHLVGLSIFDGKRFRKIDS
jgi:hypothetical protein